MASNNDDGNNNNNNNLKADIASATEKVTGFLSTKVDDTKQYLEAKQRKFEISNEGTQLERTKEQVQGWFDKEIVQRAEDTKEGFQKMMGEDNNNNRNRNENEIRGVGEGDLDDGVCGTGEFNCNNPCGMFST